MEIVVWFVGRRGERGGGFRRICALFGREIRDMGGDREGRRERERKTLRDVRVFSYGTALSGTALHHTALHWTVLHWALGSAPCPSEKQDNSLMFAVAVLLLLLLLVTAAAAVVIVMVNTQIGILIQAKE